MLENFEIGHLDRWDANFIFISSTTLDHQNMRFKILRMIKIIKSSNRKFKKILLANKFKSNYY